MILVESSENQFDPDAGDEGADATADNTLREWIKLVGGTEPWRSMHRDDQSGEMRAVLVEMLDECGETTTRRRRLRCAAMSHGQFRRAQRCSDGVLAMDFVAVRDALREALIAEGESYAVARTRSQALTPDCRLAHQAASAAYAGRRWNPEADD